jgi:hypothetical protein
LADVAALLAFSVLAVALFSGAWTDPSRKLVGPAGDNILTVWTLGWVAHALAGGHNLFYSHLVGAPGGVNLLSSTPLTLGGIVLSPLTLLAGPVVSYNVAATAALALSAWVAYLCLRRYARGRIGPLIGGLVFGFSPALIAQSYGHLQVTTAFLVPLLVILIDEALVRDRYPAALVGGAMGLTLTAQLLLSAEALATEVLMGAILVVVLAVGHPRMVRARLRRGSVVAGIALAVLVIVGAYPIYFELAGPGHTVGGAIRGLDAYVNDLSNLVLPTSVQALGPVGVAAHFAAGTVESNGYLGIPLLVVVGWTLWRYRRVAAVPVAGVMGIVALVLSLGPDLEIAGQSTGIPLPWAIFDHLPVLRDALPARLALYTDLAAALIAAVGLGEVEAAVRASLAPSPVVLPGRLSRPRARRLAVVGCTAVVGVVVTLFPAIPFPSSRPTVPAFFASPASSAAIPTGSVAVLLPLDTSSSLLWQARAGLRFSMPENHFGTGPVPPSPLGPLATALLSAQATGTIPPPKAEGQMRVRLVKTCVASVVAGPMVHEAAVVTLVTAVIGQPGRQVGGVYLWSIPLGRDCAHWGPS